MKHRKACAIALICCLVGCARQEGSTPASITSAPAEEQSATSATNSQMPSQSESAHNDASSTGLLSSSDDVALIPTDDYAQGYVFEYDGQEFIAYFDTYSWRVYDSYRITNHNDIVCICQALLDEHPVHGSDWESWRTAEDMAFEWEQHNLAYQLLPEDSAWREDVKDVDLDPDDQGMTFQEMYESRTGQAFDPSCFIGDRDW